MIRTKKLPDNILDRIPDLISVRKQLVDFIEKNQMLYLDFQYYRKQYNSVFREHLGIK